MVMVFLPAENYQHGKKKKKKRKKKKRAWNSEELEGLKPGPFMFLFAFVDRLEVTVPVGFSLLCCLLVA